MEWDVLALMCRLVDVIFGSSGSKAVSLRIIMPLVLLLLLFHVHQIMCQGHYVILGHITTLWNPYNNTTLPTRLVSQGKKYSFGFIHSWYTFICY